MAFRVSCLNINATRVVQFVNKDLDTVQNALLPVQNLQANSGEGPGDPYTKVRALWSIATYGESMLPSTLKQSCTEG